MPRLRLPPLPPVAEWRDVFPRTGGHPYKTAVMKTKFDATVNTREANYRTSIANPALCDKFVRDLGLRENEVVIDAYSGAGQMTRSLLAGGYNQTTAKDWESVKKEQEVVGPRIGERSRKINAEFDYPPWDVKKTPSPAKTGLKTGEEVTVPKLVIAADSHFASLSRGLGLHPTAGGPELPKPWAKKPDDPTRKNRLGKPEHHRGMYPSLLQKDLVFAAHSVYNWSTVPDILTDPLVLPSLEVYDKTKTGPDATYRPWSAPPPPITLLATIPNTVYGDQMISQWISSAIGSDDYGRAWLWKWGRVRVATLVHKGLYDRILARPGETIHCKLSVMAHALFNIRPLPPYHHVPDVDKASLRTHTSTILKSKHKTQRAKPTKAAKPPTDEVTITRMLDFYNWGGTRLAKDKIAENPYLPRPLLLGIEFTPRLDTPIKVEQRDLWDFVLRKCFVRETTDIGDAIPKLAFGAENLVPRFAEEKGATRYAGDPVTPDTTVRDLTVDQWARVVDVIDKWAFKPEDLLADVPILEESREIGTSM